MLWVQMAVTQSTVAEGLQQMFGWFRSFTSALSTDANARTFYQSVYPESVRYALQYNKAQLGKAELNALIPLWHFEVVYLLTKLLAFDREYQRQFLEALTRLYYHDDWTLPQLRTLLKEYIARLPDDRTVTATKLSQLSRIGTHTWQQEWSRLARRVIAEQPDALPCLIAHTPIYAYHHFVAIYKAHRRKKLLLLMPDWIIDADATQMGYAITLTEPPTVTLQVKQECLYGAWACEGTDCKFHQYFCQDAIFIDDTINTAQTASKLQSFWLSKYGLTMPLERVYAITNLRKHAPTNQ